MFMTTDPIGDTLFSLNGIISGGVGTLIVGAVIWVGKLILDRTVPSRSDSRANMSLVLEGLNSVVKVLQEEKSADSKRLESKTTRIEMLEAAADKDYDRISELRAEIIDLRNRLAVKDRHINAMVSELRKMGREVTGLELEDIEITMTPEQVKDFRKAFETGPTNTV